MESQQHQENQQAQQVQQPPKSTSKKYISTQDLDKFRKELNTALNDYLAEQLNKNTESLLQQINVMFQDRDAEEENNSMEYDDDHDVIMRNGITSSVTPVPDPGLFTGETSQTKLFCELCDSLLNTYPYSQLTEGEKINFIFSRLRGSARTWYHIKYKYENPNSAENILEELNKAFSNVTSIKLAKIQLIELRQSFGKIDEYIEKFRNYSCCLEIDDTSLSLLFLNGLHPKYKNEIKKADVLPDTLEEIVTKCILYENSLKTNNKLNIHSNNNNKSHNNKRKNNKNHRRNYSKNHNNNYNNHYSNNNNNHDNNIRAQKISSKN